MDWLICIGFYAGIGLLFALFIKGENDFNRFNWSERTREARMKSESKRQAETEDLMVNFLSRQEPFGPDFERAIFDDIEELYETNNKGGE